MFIKIFITSAIFHITFVRLIRKVEYIIYYVFFLLMIKKYKIYAMELAEMENKLNHFFERYPYIDIRSINSSRCIATNEFVRGRNQKHIVFSILYD